MSQDLVYLLLIFGLLVIPRALQRFSVPAPITSMLLGLGAMLAFGERAHDPVVVLLSTIGISSLFLFAGLEVDPAALRRGLWKLLGYLAVRAGGLVLVGGLAMRWLELGWQAAALLALAVLTPSTGFILDTLERLGLEEEERFWVTSNAIVGELMALAVMFVVLQAADPVQLGVSSLWMAGMAVGLPLLFIALGRWVVPHAPGSEFSLLVMVGLVAAYITYRLGVYYLVGAFVAGFVARMLRIRMPRLASDTNIHALRLFASFFVPFYFFHAGTGISRDALSWEAAALGLGITVAVLPLRIGLGWLQRRLMFGEGRGASLKISVALAPTLVFTLVLADILYSRFHIPGTLFGALILYTTLNTLLPTLVLRTPFDLDPAAGAGGRVHPEDRMNGTHLATPSQPPGPRT
ncbi:cation:proton antiporter [Lysobacter sp. GX 14042]|uniref:cation:proton antiporter n=1 Tax=Lysobacter sp. GX 14042 TaxID=2907155 RepID=UPI001F19D9FC|nr:cation:proton antiporter [Lysobacter sp. GX 14042]MCE7031148.1 cation:proton antiporter [Lysobacter sp. GX 14042]